MKSTRLLSAIVLSCSAKRIIAAMKRPARRQPAANTLTLLGGGTLPTPPSPDQARLEAHPV